MVCDGSFRPGRLAEEDSIDCQGRVNRDEVLDGAGVSGFEEISGEPDGPGEPGEAQDDREGGGEEFWDSNSRRQKGDSADGQDVHD